MRTSKIYILQYEVFIVTSSGYKSCNCCRKKCITRASELCILSKMLAILTLLQVTKKAIVYIYIFKMFLTFNTSNIHYIIIIIDHNDVMKHQKKSYWFCFVCLFGVSRLHENFSLVWSRHHNMYQIRAANFDQWGFLPCHTYCNKGQPFIMVISEDPWHSHLLPSV